MKKNRLFYALIKSAIEKGIHDVREDPRRGIRNLVDLGGMFAKSDTQKGFFDMLESEIQKEDSRYYNLVERIFRETDTEMLTTFCTNLGYTALICGSRQLRKNEQDGIVAPWCLFNMIQSDDRPFLPGVMEQGKELGIYCYILRIGENMSDLETAVEMAQAQPDCAFAILVHPGQVTRETAIRICKAKNIIVAIEVREIQALEDAVAYLRHAHCLFGGYYCDGNTSVPSDDMLGRCMELNMTFLLSMRPENARKEIGADLAGLRRNLPYPVLPLDLYFDMLHVGGSICSESFLATIQTDGSVVITEGINGSVDTGYNVHNTPLIEIFSNHMRKKIKPSLA